MKKGTVIKCLDLMAKAVSVLNSFSREFSQLYAISNYDDIEKNEFERLENRWKQNDYDAFLKYLSNSIRKLNNNSDNSIVQALAICLWMDNKIHYWGRAKGKICIRELIPCENEVIQIDCLNTNYKRTGIQIMPKLEINKLHYQSDESATEKDSDDNSKNNTRAFSNRNGLEGLNSVLENVIVVKYDEHTHVHNIIIRESLKSEQSELMISCCPMGDNITPLVEKTQIAFTKTSFSGLCCCGFENDEAIEERFCNDWMLAADSSDIVLFPEGIGTQNLYDTITVGTTKYNSMVRRLLEERSQHGERVPCLTVMPSRCSCGVNASDVIFRTGKILCEQRKYFPYVDIKNHTIEAIQDCEQKDYYVIHIPPFHRIAILICSEFLGVCNGQIQSPLFKEMGVSLVLVPSFSPGELDFINAISSLKCFGTTAIWLNCCSARNNQRRGQANSAIGAASIAGMNKTLEFQEVSKCANVCNGNSACSFLVPLPLHMIDSRNRMSNINIIKHFTILDKKNNSKMYNQ